MVRHLEFVRFDLGTHQNNKLEAKWDKYGDYRNWTVIAAVKALYDELLELKSSIDKGDIKNMKEEIIDVRNTSEFLWDFLSKVKDT